MKENSALRKYRLDDTIGLLEKREDRFLCLDCMAERAAVGELLLAHNVKERLTCALCGKELGA